MHIQRMANRHQRGIERAGIGTTITRPQYRLCVELRKGMGWYSEGPIDNPKDLGPAIEARARRGQARRTGFAGYRHAAPLARPVS